MVSSVNVARWSADFSRHGRPTSVGRWVVRLPWWAEAHRPCRLESALRLALLLVVCWLPAWAATARLGLPDPIIPNAALEGRVVVENATASLQRVDLPRLSGIEWQVRGGRSSQTTIINGQASHTQSQGIVLRIAAAGTYQIPAINILLADGSTLATAPLTVTVKPGDANLSGEAVAEASFEPEVIVPGQPTTLTVRVLLRQDRLRATQEKPQVGPPAEAISLGEMTTSTGSTFDAAGNQWSVRTWRWPITFARSGTYPITGQQTWYLCRRTFFNELEPIAERQVPIRPATLTVTALPGEGRPDDFTGLIGAVTVSAVLDRNRIATGEGALLTVTYRGRGVELLGRPQPAIAGVTVYPKEDDAKADDTPGERTFRWDLVPATAGTVTVPAFSVPFFDPGSRTYRRGASEPLTLTVIPGRARTLEVAGRLAPDPTAAATAAPAAVVLTGLAALPPPLRGSGATAIPWRWSLSLLIAGLALGLVIGVAGRLAGSLRRGPHRGQALATAIATNDLDRIATALHQLMPALATDAQRDAARRLQQAVDVARFGRQPLAGDAVALAKTLEGVA